MNTLIGLDALAAAPYSVGDVYSVGQKYSVGNDQYSVGDVDTSSLISTLFNAGGEITNKAIDYKKGEDQKAQSQKDSAAKLEAVLKADAAATDSLAQALYSTDLATTTPAGPAKDAALLKSNTDTALAAQATAMQDAAASGLSADGATKRLAAAQTALNDATKKAGDAATALTKAPTDSALKAKAQQLTQTNNRPPTPEELAKAKADMEKNAAPQESFLNKKIVGDVEVWHAGVGVGGALSLGWLVKRWLARRSGRR
jgi:hypothetical protein